MRWPILSLPLPSGPVVAVSIDYFGPLPAIPRGNYIPLFKDRFIRRADMYATSVAEFTAEGTVDPKSTCTYIFGGVPPAPCPIKGCNSVQGVTCRV